MQPERKGKTPNLSKISPVGHSTDSLVGRNGFGFSYRKMYKPERESSSSNKYSSLSTNGRKSSSYYSPEEEQEFYQIAIGFNIQLDVNDPLKRVPIAGLFKKAEDRQVPKDK